MTVRKSLFSLLSAQAQEFNNVCFIEFNVTGADDTSLILTTADAVKYRVEGDTITLLSDGTAGAEDGVTPQAPQADLGNAPSSAPADVQGAGSVAAGPTSSEPSAPDTAPVTPPDAPVDAQAPVAPAVDAVGNVPTTAPDASQAQDVSSAGSDPAPASSPADASAPPADTVTATPAGADAAGGSAPDVGAAAASPGVDPAQGVAANDAGTAPASQDVKDALTVEQRLTSILTSMNAIAIDGTGTFADGHPVFAVRGQEGTEVARGTILQLEQQVEAKAGV